MNHIVLDLTSDEKDDEKVENEDNDDGDCVILDYDPTLKRIVVETCETDEVIVTGQKYEIACRDFPHPRHACAKYPFKSTLHQQYCEKCYCYVCDTRAPCPYWFNGFSTDHCHANDKEQTWQNQRKRIKTINTVSKLAPTIAQCKRVSSPRPVPLLQNLPTPATQLGIKACSRSASLTRHTRPGYRTEQSRPQAVNSNPYLSTQRPSRGVSFMANDEQSIAQRLSHAMHYASPVPSLSNAQQIASSGFSTVPLPSLSNAQQIVTGGFSTVPVVSHSKEYATHFYRNMNSGNLQTNAVPSMTPNPPANQEKQQPGRSKDKVLSALEDWLLDDSTSLGCGGIAVDFLATVDSYPQPDDKLRSTSLKVQGGGNAANALTCAARLGLNSRLISKVANDSQGKRMLEELEADGVDTSFLVVSKEGNSPFTYVIVDNQTKTRTCIHTPGDPPMLPTDLSQSSILSALDRASIVYFDVRLHETALMIAKEASRQKIPILVDAENKRDGLDDLLQLADYVVCSAKLPQAWTEVSSTPGALISMLLRLPKLKFVIVTLGEEGCLMLQRASKAEVLESQETDIERLLETLKHRKDSDTKFPTCVTSETTKLKADGIGTVSARLFLGTAEKIPPEELLDTTGAGDAFIGAILYAICAGMPPEKMLPFAAQVAGCSCRALGARAGLPQRTDPRLVPFLV